MTERRRRLDEEALALFARKGFEGGPDVPQAGVANAVKVRRIVQLATDLTGRPPADLRVLDLGCGEGVYSIELALAGADVVAVDARTERMEQGMAVAARHGLENVRFEVADARRITRETHGDFDVVLLLGLLYHFDAPEVFEVLTNVRDLADRLLLVDTLVSLDAPETVEWRGRAYRGERVREHEDDDSPEVRRARLLRSVESTFAFRFGRDSLVGVLLDTGFTSVLECRAPLEPGKAADRVTLAAIPGGAVRVETYPFVNGLAEEEIARAIRAGEEGGA